MFEFAFDQPWTEPAENGPAAAPEFEPPPTTRTNTPKPLFSPAYHESLCKCPGVRLREPSPPSRTIVDFVVVEPSP